MERPVLMTQTGGNDAEADGHDCEARVHNAQVGDGYRYNAECRMVLVQGILHGMVKRGTKMQNGV